MTTIRIIETDTIQAGDLIAFRFGAVEVAGIVRSINDCGAFVVKTLGLGILEVSHENVTDIC